MSSVKQQTEDFKTGMVLCITENDLTYIFFLLLTAVILLDPVVQ